MRNTLGTVFERVLDSTLTPSVHILPVAVGSFLGVQHATTRLWNLQSISKRRIRMAGECQRFTGGLNQGNGVV